MQYDRANSDFAIRVRDVAEEALALRDCSADFWDFVARQGVTHIFIGTQGGPLQPRVWDQCVGVRRIYMGADVHIYEIVAPVEFEPE
ncbi:MAG: hypothetical protein BWY63_02169 [Chloroflexi bacterium ADurb.Bin360]|nr:MAG: hypothetical protein BWY63_02169 [Chloroflexi bacterium ADurb.Bin360]